MQEFLVGVVVVTASGIAAFIRYRYHQTIVRLIGEIRDLLKQSIDQDGTGEQ